MKRLENKIAFLTGGSRGIGAAIAKGLAAEGATVTFTYAKAAERAMQVVSEIENEGEQARAIAADCGDPGALAGAIQETAGRHGRIDILISNAGIFIGKPFENYTAEDYEATMAVNVRAVFIAAQEAIRHMGPGGRIITIGSSMADLAGGPETTLYTMSKSALTGLTKGLARDLGPRQITVNLVQPGPIDTDMNPADAPLADILRAGMALPEYGSGEDISGLVNYLASEEGRYITGSSLTIDGGFTA